MASPSSLTDGGKAALDTTAEPQSPCSTLAAEDSVKFYDRSGEECESFIREVRKVAFREGKSRDTNWMADFASTCFFGQALRWYEALDLSVRCDWEGLKRALLEKYPSDMEPVMFVLALEAPVVASTDQDLPERHQYYRLLTMLRSSRRRLHR